MPASIQQQFITIVDELSKSSTETGTLIVQFESDIEAIQQEIDAKMATSSLFALPILRILNSILKEKMSIGSIINNLLNVLYVILTGIGNSYDSIGEDVQVIANCFEDLGNVVGKPGSNVLIRKSEGR